MLGATCAMPHNFNVINFNIQVPATEQQKDTNPREMSPCTVGYSLLRSQQICVLGGWGNAEYTTQMALNNSHHINNQDMYKRCHSCTKGAHTKTLCTQALIHNAIQQTYEVHNFVTTIKPNTTTVQQPQKIELKILKR